MRAVGAVIALLWLGGQTLAQDMPLSQILIEGEGWQFAWKVERNENPLAPGGRLYWAGDRYYTQLARTGDRAVFYFATPAMFRNPFTDSPRRFDVPLAEPTGLVLTPDGGTLVVADAGGKALWAFRVEKDGSLGSGEPYYALRMRKGSNRSDATTLTIDRDGRVYAATPEGVQVFDPTGRLCGVLLPPERAPVTDVWLGDDKLFVTCGDKEFKRKLNTRGVQ